MRNRRVKSITVAAVLLFQIVMGSLVFAGSRSMPPQYSPRSTSVNYDGYMGLPRESEMSLSLAKRLQSQSKMMHGVESTLEYRDVTVTFGRHMARRQREEVLKAIDYVKDTYEPLWGMPVSNAKLYMYFTSTMAESMRYATELYSPENGYSTETLLKETRYLREHGKESSCGYTLTHNNGTTIIITDSEEIVSFRGVVFHEMTHYYQRVFGGLKSSDKVQWFKEGQACCNEDVIYANGSTAVQANVNDNVANYRSLMQLSTSFAPPANTNMVEAYFRTYNLSYHAVQYLTETYGQQKLINFVMYLSNHPYLGMNQSLKEYFGISIEQLNKIAMQAVAKNQEEVNRNGFLRQKNYEYY